MSGLPIRRSRAEALIACADKLDEARSMDWERAEVQIAAVALALRTMAEDLDNGVLTDPRPQEPA